MGRSFRLILSGSLVIFLLFVGGLLQSQTVAHSLHHIHHKAATHATAICSWMCAAGQVLEASNPVWESASTIIGTIDTAPPSNFVSIHTTSSNSRAPPIFTF